MAEGALVLRRNIARISSNTLLWPSVVSSLLVCLQCEWPVGARVSLTLSALAQVRLENGRWMFFMDTAKNYRGQFQRPPDRAG